MVLVDADRVESAFRRVFELIHEIVVHVMGALGIEQAGRNVHPNRVVLLPEILGKFRIGHQVEPELFHGALLLASIATRRAGAAR